MERWKSALAGVVNQEGKHIFSQVLVVLSILGAFLSAACIDKRTVWRQYGTAYAFTLILDIFLVLAWCWRLTAAFEKSGSFFGQLKRIGSRLEKRQGIFIALVFCCLTRVVQLQDTPKWDALIYYNVLMEACENFDFTFSQYWSSFALAAHPTRGYVSLLAIGEFLFTGQYIGVTLMNLILALLAVVCTYRILEKIMPKTAWTYITLATCFVFSTPMFLGTFSYFQPDGGLAYFFIYIVYCFLFKKNILMFFFIALLVQTKEVGILILGGLVSGILLCRLCWGKEETLWQRATGFLKSPLGLFCIAGSLLGAIYILMILRTGALIWSYGQNEVSEYMSTFTFIPEYIARRLKSIFLLNFNWMIWGLNLILLLCSIWKRKRYSFSHKVLLYSAFLSALILILFYCGYITFLLPRYHVIIEFFAGLIFVILLRKSGIKLRWRNWGITLIGCLLLIQAYITIDPLSLAVFRNYPTGNGRIISECVYNPLLQKDYTVYNHQFNYLDRAYDRILRDVGYHEGMDVWVWTNDTNTQIWTGGFVWDTEKQKRTLVSNENTIEIRGFARQDEEIGLDLQLNREAVFLLIPQFGITEEYAEEFLNSYYEIRYKGYVEIPMGGIVSYYVCDLIGERVIEN